MNRVNIIGAGLAGLSAALALAEQGISCRLISQMPSERAQSALAEGGINAALDVSGESDSTDQHFADTMRGGCGLADPRAVRALTEAAPEIVSGLQQRGVPFALKDGQLLQRAFGGQKKKRTAFAQNSTGKAILNALIDAARRHEAEGLIDRKDHHLFLGLLLDGGLCRGVRIQDRFSGETKELKGPVILAFGGPCGLFSGQTTGTVLNDATALAIVFSQGMPLANLEFIQYHPTTVAIEGKRLLVSESARGEGGRLFVIRDGAPWYFMEELYPGQGNLAPRDVVSRQMDELLRREDCGGRVWLDLRGLSKVCWRTRLPDLRRELLERLGVDPAKEPVQVSPGIHYFMGGIDVDLRHRTGIPCVWAAGECACIYHGANRLGGNSLLGAVFGGKTAAEDAASYMASERPVQWREDDFGADAPASSDALTDRSFYLDSQSLHTWREPDAASRMNGTLADPGFYRELSAVLSKGLGIRRDAAGLSESLFDLGKLRARQTASMERMLCDLAEAMTKSALFREESRGAHVRADFPRQDDENWLGDSVAVHQNGGIQVAFRKRTTCFR